MRPEIDKFLDLYFSNFDESPKEIMEARGGKAKQGACYFLFLLTGESYDLISRVLHQYTGVMISNNTVRRAIELGMRNQLGDDVRQIVKSCYEKKNTL